MKRLVVGTNGTTQSAHAMKWAIEAFGPSVELELVFAFTPQTVRAVERSETERHSNVPASYAPEIVGAGVMQEERDQRAELLHRRWIAPAADANVSYRAALVDGPPGLVLAGEADGADVDAIVVGAETSHGETRLRTVARQIARQSHRPVVVVPDVAPIEPIETLVVGLDGSEASVSAAEFASDVAQASAATVVAVHGFQRFYELYPDWDHRSHTGRARHAVSEWSEAIATTGVSTEALAVEGRPVRAILDTADEMNAGLIVVGARGAGGMHGLGLGGTAAAVLSRCTRPVAIVR